MKTALFVIEMLSFAARYLLAVAIFFMPAACQTVQAGTLDFGVQWGFKLGLTAGPLDMQRAAQRHERQMQRDAQQFQLQQQRQASYSRTPRLNAYRAPAYAPVQYRYQAAPVRVYAAPPPSRSYRPCL